MGAAEDAIRDRLNTAARNATSENRPDHEWPAQLRQQIRDEIPAVLSLLHKLEWPGGTLISVSTAEKPSDSLIGELKAEAKEFLSEIRGMWSEITGHDYNKRPFVEFGARKIYDNKSNEPSEWMYLLSDGRLTLGSDPVDLNDLDIEQLRGCADGLNTLRQKLARRAS